MHRHNSFAMTLLILALFISTLVAGITLGAKVVLGYTGFYDLHYQSDAIRLNDECQSRYFLVKFGESLQMEIRVAYLGCLVAAGSGAVALLTITLMMVCFRRKKNNNAWISEGINRERQNSLTKNPSI